MREIVIVITDLYLPAEGGAALPAGGPADAMPGIEFAGRFGERGTLPQGWRAWLAQSVGRADLAGASPARVAAAVLRACGVPGPGDEGVTRWMASPVHLSAGLSRVHLDPRGLLRLDPGELAALAADFAQVFAASGFTLAALPGGEFLLSAPGIPAVRTTEPARCAGGDLAGALPQGAAAAPLRRTAAEIEMWLHAQPVNLARSARGEAPVSALWLWGAEGDAAPVEPRADPGRAVAFGADPYLSGLWHLQGAVCHAVPPTLEPVLTETRAPRAVLALRAGASLQESAHSSFAQAVGRLDERFVAPALRQLKGGALESLTLVANDIRLTVRRGSAWRRWRRGRAGLAVFA